MEKMCHVNRVGGIVPVLALTRLNVLKVCPSLETGLKHAIGYDCIGSNDSSVGCLPMNLQASPGLSTCIW